MSTDPKSTKPMPSADEINAYLEASAARTKLRLPLAQGKPLAGGPAPAPAAEKGAPRTLPVSKKLPTQREEPQHSSKLPGTAEKSSAEPTAGEVWRPFPSDDDR